jgi:hypothetical protein
MRWNVNVVLICIACMARDVEHFFMCFLVIWTSSFENALFSSFAHFYIESLIFGELSFLSSLLLGPWHSWGGRGVPRLTPKPHPHIQIYDCLENSPDCFPACKATGTSCFSTSYAYRPILSSDHRQMEASGPAVLWEEHPPSPVVSPLLQSPLLIPAKLLHSEPNSQQGSLAPNKSFFSTCGAVSVQQFLTPILVMNPLSDV